MHGSENNLKTPLWELREISKAFPGVQALDRVSLDLYAGEVHALLGENGCGKSTLAKCLSGVHQPEHGTMLYQGKAVTFRNPMEARALGVATIYQEFSLVPTLTVAENVFLGRYPRNPAGMIDWDVVKRQTQEVLQELSLKIDPDAMVKELSVAEQQLVEIAKAISLESNLLIMDEPTAALGLEETQHLMEVIRRLTTQNKAIIYISHRLDEVFQIADRVTILKDGKQVASAPASKFKMGDVVRLMIGFDIQQHYPKEHNSRDTVCLELDDVSTENGIDGITFEVKVGEVFGLGGMLGSGRTEIARAIYGLDPLVRGQFRLFGRNVRFRSPTQAIDAGIGLIPENRKVDGCFFNFDGPKNITISNLRNLLRGPFLSISTEWKVGETFIKKLNISRTAMEKSVMYLSGGNQQKVIIARWLHSQARLLILDEPTQGIDIGAKLEVYRVINELTANGISVVLISSDFPELLAMSDRVAIVRDGRILSIAEAKRMTEYQLIGLASGVGISEEIDEWMQLREIAHAHLKTLQEQTQATAQLAVLDRREMTLFYLDRIGHKKNAVPVRSGATGPFDGTGLGKLLLAYEPLVHVREWIESEGFIQDPDHPIPDPGVFLDEIQTVRQCGFNQEWEEKGILSIAAPVLDAHGEAIAGISVSIPAEKDPDDIAHSPLRSRVLEVAAAISRDFSASKS